jgi:hypothetical protein
MNLISGGGNMDISLQLISVTHNAAKNMQQAVLCSEVHCR